MKVNLETTINDITGKPVKNETQETITIRKVLSQALLSAGQDEKDQEKKYKRYLLLTDINNAKNTGIEISSEQASDLKYLTNETYGPLVYGQVVDAIEKNKT